jgi:dihydroorotase
VTRATLIRGARLLDPGQKLDRPGNLLIQDGKIAALEGAIPVAPDWEVVDGTDLCLAPGLIDLRVHLREPGDEHVESLEVLAEAAAAGGVTTLAGLPGTEPRVENPALILHLRRRFESIGKARLLPWGAITHHASAAGASKGGMCEMGLMLEAGAIGFTDAPIALADAGVMRRAMSYARAFDALIHNHPLDPGLAGAGVATEGEMATRMGLPGMPPMAELLMVERDLRLAELTGGRLHLGPLTTAASIDAVRQAKRRGLAVTADTAPAYFALNELAIGDYRTDAKVSPPLRSEADRLAVVAGLADGTIDAIASDHAPQDRDGKRLPYATAATGMIGIETLLPLSLSLAQTGALGLSDLLSKLTSGPARILKRPLGSLAVGAPADLLLFDPNRAGRIDARALRSTMRNTPFDRRPIEGRVVGCWFEGRRVFSAGTA